MRTGLLALFLLISGYIFALVAVTGRVVNPDEVPIGGAIIVETGTNNYTISDINGAFTLFMGTVSNQIEVSAVGYQKVRMDVNPAGELIIFLQAELYGNPYVLAGYSGYTDFRVKNPNKQLENMPYMLGEADINRQLQMLPGVEFGSEGFSNLYVRGGNVDENLMLYNGTPVYNFNHLFGFTSIFQRNSVYNTQVYKGSMPSKFGGRLSSTILIESDNELEYSGTSGVFEAGPLSAGLYIKTVKRGDYFFNVSMRRTWLDQLIPKEIRDNELNFNYHDIQVNFGFTLDQNSELEFSFLNTRDYYKAVFVIPTDSNNLENTRYELRLKWGNTLGAVRYKHRFSKQLYSEHSLHLSQFYSNNDFYEEILNATSGSIPTSSQIYKSGIREYIARSNYQYAISNQRNLEFGLNVNVKTFRTGFIELSSVDYPNIPDRQETLGRKSYEPSLEVTVYGDYVQWISKKMQVIGGMRLSLYSFKGFMKPYFQPRAHLTYLLSETAIFKVAYTRQNQFAKLLNLGGSEDPANFWVPATDYARPGSSDIVEATLEKALDEQYSLCISAYYKLLNSILAVENFNDAISPDNDWQAYTSIGSGNIYGAEFMLQKNEGMFTGWLSYVYSRSTRSFPDLHKEPFLFDFDRTHIAKIYAACEINDLWSFGVNYVLGSGQLFTVPIGKFLDADGILQLEYGSLNNYRSMPYNRLDISLIKNRERGGIDQTWKFYVYNLTASRNPLSITPEFADASYSNIVLNRTYFSMIPGVSYVVKF